jgi:CDP-glycerol glycerophosphotransferase
MKIDKRNYRHWFILICSGIFALIGAVLRPLGRQGKPLVVLYGHKLNGNLKAFADYLEHSSANAGAYTIAYATLDPQYYHEVKAENPNVEVLSMRSLGDMIKIGRASVIITSHGLHTLTIFKALTKIKFVNVWHGIGWKGHDPKEFSFLKGYAENWVSSPTFKNVYKNFFKIQSPAYVTGYARSDESVKGRFSVTEIKRKYGIDPKYKKIVLVAPTWEQGHGRHSIYPFGLTADQFFTALNEAGKQLGGLVIFRSHLNSKTAELPDGLDNLVLMPYGKYPVVEDFLYMADVLVSDWSSIVFDYLPLGRPVVFLDVPSPYERLCIDANCRYGALASSAGELTEYIRRYADDPGAFKKKFAKSIREAIRVGYGDTLDGMSAKRYHQRLLKLIKKELKNEH